MNQSQPITTKGARGYLQWLKINQPVIYKAILPKLQQPNLSGLGDDSGSMFLTASVDAGNMFSTPSDLTTTSSMVSVPSLDPIATASTSPAPSSWVNNISALVQTASQAYLTKAQIDAQTQLTNTQLARAAQGLPPLNINPANYGLSATVGVGGSNNMLLWGAVGLGLIFVLPSLLGGSSSRRR